MTDRARWRSDQGSGRRFSTTRLGRLVALMVFGLGCGSAVNGQIPGIPAAPKAAPAPKHDPTQKPVAAKGEQGAVFTATSGPIKVDQVIDDPGIEATLNDLLAQYPGVRSVAVKAKQGFVTLDGQADDDDTIDDVTAFAQKVEGVRLVINKMKTDAEVLTGPEIAADLLRHYRHIVARNWLLALVAVGFLFGFTALARLFGRYSDTILAPFFRNSLLRSVIGSIFSSALIVAGIMIALSVLNLTQAVLSILGLAGVAGLALGFAFRDIVENFIASMLLGLRRPFGIGDFITVAGRSGSVLSLDTRATTLITPEGNHVRIPNAVIYKETLVNASVTPNVLGSIEVVIPYEASTAAALEAINEALGSNENLLSEPRPRALVLGLESGGVRLKATFWMPTKGVDGDKLQSDLRLKIKVGLQQAGVIASTSQGGASVLDPVKAETTPLQTPSNGSVARSPELSPPPSAASIAEANLRKDTEAAARSETEPTHPQAASPIDHAIRQAEAAAVAEGGNMLVNTTKG